MIKVDNNGDVKIRSANHDINIESSSVYRYFDIVCDAFYFSIENAEHFDQSKNSYNRLTLCTVISFVPYFKKVIDFFHWEFTLENDDMKKYL